jgi:hypothetical protein
MVNATKTVVVPTDPKQLKLIKSKIREGTDCLLRMDAEREALKDIVEAINEEFELPKAYISKMIRFEHAADFDKKTTEFDDLQTLYEAIKNA